MLILHVSCPVLELLFLQKPLLENDIKNQDLGARYACHYWHVITSKALSADRARKYKCVCEPVCTHIYNISLCNHL